MRRFCLHIYANIFLTNFSRDVLYYSWIVRRVDSQVHRVGSHKIQSIYDDLPKGIVNFVPNRVH